MLKSAALFILATIVLLAPQDSVANSEKYKARLDAIQKTESTCMDKLGETTAGMLDCMGRAANQLDTLLTDSYNHLRKAVRDDPVFFDALKTEQLAWIKIRKAASARSAAPYGGGTAGTLTSASVYNTILRNRIDFFIYLIQCTEPIGE